MHWNYPIVVNCSANTFAKLCDCEPNHIAVNDTEDAAITAAAMSDPDAVPFTDEQWAAIKPGVRTGRPKAEVTKERITIRLSRDVVTQFRATGVGWQTRMDAALRQYIAEHPITP